MRRGGGTQEGKRRRKAMPAPAGSRGGLVYLVAFVLLFALCAAGLYADSHRTAAAIVALPAAALVVLGLRHQSRRFSLLGRVSREWTPRGVRCLVVHSDSRLWSAHIASRWLPRLGPMAVTLDWSERSRWPDSLEADVFRHFCERGGSFNPAVVVFRGLRGPLVFRFYDAFREARKGHPEYRDELEQDMFEAVGEPGESTS